SILKSANIARNLSSVKMETSGQNASLSYSALAIVSFGPKKDPQNTPLLELREKLILDQTSLN
ncbi:hypothetical protein, partial [Vibrio campbellii]|uniref:hypothetical protein n=1 Tax=Vibrio campbellii TaxID=680 RepID=UPI000A4D5882